MTLVPLMIEALGPLAFPERKPGVQFRTSLPYVPGAAIYGALGALLGPARQGTQEEFARLFRQIRCHNAYPALDGDPWVRPLPMTAMQPKGGKPSDSDLSKPKRTYTDSLYARVCWEQQQPAALLYTPTDDDGRPWEAVGRTFYTLERHDDTAWQPSDAFETAGIGIRDVTQRVLTRVMINRRRGTAEDSRLYSPLVISEVMEARDKELVPTRFAGSIVVPEGDVHILPMIEHIVAIGGRQTTGIGAVKIIQRPEASEDNDAYLRRRVADMSARFEKQAALYQAFGGDVWRDENEKALETPGTVFTINLLSDAILLDQGWLPTNEFSAALLNACTGINATLVRAFTTSSIVGGWNVSWQRHKPTAVKTQMGSVFVFRVSGPLSNDDYAKLALLERDGIGERRAEGYGHIRICDEFHLLPEEAI